MQFYEQLLTKMSFYHSYQIPMSLELQFIVKNIVFNQKLAILAPIKVPKMLKNFKFCENWEFQNLFCALTGKKLIFWVRQLNKISKLGWNTTYTTNFRLIYRKIQFSTFRLAVLKNTVFILEGTFESYFRDKNGKFRHFELKFSEKLYFHLILMSTKFRNSTINHFSKIRVHNFEFQRFAPKFRKLVRFQNYDRGRRTNNWFLNSIQKKTNFCYMPRNFLTKFQIIQVKIATLTAKFGLSWIIFEKNLWNVVKVAIFIRIRWNFVRRLHGI